MYRAIEKFADLQDGGHVYQIGDMFPRTGLNVGDERIIELSSDKNRRGIPLIEFVEDSHEEMAVEQKTEEKPKRGRKKVK